MKNDRREDGEGEMMKNSQGLTDRAKERSDTEDRRYRRQTAKLKNACCAVNCSQAARC